MYQQIRNLRQDAQLTQLAVAQQLRIHRMTYVRYETGKRDIPLKIAIDLADFYNVTLDSLAERTPGTD